jgi:hypothetical protein
VRGQEVYDSDVDLAAAICLAHHFVLLEEVERILHSLTPIEKEITFDSRKVPIEQLSS